MKPHELRLAQQHTRNRCYLQNLDGFINSPRFMSVPPKDQELMLRQAQVMSDLDHVLTARMKSLNLPV